MIDNKGNEFDSKDAICAALDGFDYFEILSEVKGRYKFQIDIKQAVKSTLIQNLNNRLNPISNNIGWAKIGMELFDSAAYANFDVIDFISGKELKIFLDLKLKDIPSTVFKTARTLACNPSVGIFNVHADGGIDMMESALNGADEASQVLGIPRPKIIGVTVLTTMDKKKLNATGVKGAVIDQVLKLAIDSEEAGLDGIVCSAADLPLLKPELPDDFIFVTPGIRFADGDAGDQKRIATPDGAIDNGSDLLVVGRPFYENLTPEQQLDAVVRMNKSILTYI